MLAILANANRFDAMSQSYAASNASKLYPAGMMVS